MNKNVVISSLGSTLDQGFGANRWNRWRPSVCICQHEDLLVSEYHLLYQKAFSRLCKKVVEDIQTVSPETEVIPHEVNFQDPWDFGEVYEVLYTFADRFRFTPEQKNYLFHITTGTHVAQICFFLLTESRHFPGKLLQTAPSDVSCGTYTMIDLDLSKYDRIAARFHQEMINDISFLKYGIETGNENFNRLMERIEHVVLKTHDPVLLMGPTGAGKSQLAKRIYELKKFKDQVKGEFVEVNCATLRGDAAMSTLFGHKKGAFTGAINGRPGLLKTAHEGMVFLDEIGELGSDEQAMLLRAIEEKKFMPLGADTEESSDFQLICGTNRDLKKEITRGAFREDLLARINLWTFSLPGLKDRREDIEPNILYELKRYEEKYGTRVTFNKEAREQFRGFAESPGAAWRANFRDLNAAITRMCTLAPGGRINKEVVHEEIGRLETQWQEESPGEDDRGLSQFFSQKQLEKIDLFDAVQLREVLKICRASGSLSEAGRTLFSVSRTRKDKTNDADRLSKYLAKFGLKWGDVR
ncbi:MAG: AAA family ATPase [bacterium]|nr:AAA family ATPase [bacterium]